jgi:DNA-binding NtrC family response regulator
VNSLPFPRAPVLIVDDEQSVLESLSDSLESNGITNVRQCRDSGQVMAILGGGEVEVVLLDLAMPHMSGRELLARIREGFPEVPVIIVTATDDVSTAVECMKGGAFDYMVKAIEEMRLVSGVRRAIEIRGLRREYRDLSTQLLRNRLRHPRAFAAMVTRDRAMQALFLLAESIARTSEPVKIIGETGVGKNLLARAIHEASEREGALVEVNVAGLDDTMFADTLFGHLKGAFTGAIDSRDGLVRKAGGGTLFLDEIGDLSPASQIKLLRLLDTREYYPLGSDLPRRTDARVVVATNRDLRGLVAEGRLRRDLFFRLATHELVIPPLRERRGDLALLLDHFVDQAARALSRDKPLVPPQVLSLVNAYDFPGNVREMRSMVFDAVSRQSSDELPVEPFKAVIGGAPSSGNRDPEEPPVFAARLPTLRQAKEALISEALKRSQGNQSIAAGLLGISHQALNQWLRKRGSE